MIQLRVFGHSRVLDDIAKRLARIHGARHVILTGAGAAGVVLLTADLVEDAVDQAVALVKRAGLPSEDIVLVRLDAIGPAVAQRPLASVIWADLLNQAGANARPLARYLVFMAAAGVIAAFGVIYAETTLIVGAMAISPDTLPISATATALVLRRWRLAVRALLTLVAGLGCACAVGAALTFALHALGLGPSQLLPGQQGSLEALSTINISTPFVAFAAGVAGMLALEDQIELGRRRGDLRHHDPCGGVPWRCGRCGRRVESPRRAGRPRRQCRHAARRRLPHPDLAARTRAT